MTDSHTLNLEKQIGDPVTSEDVTLPIEISPALKEVSGINSAQTNFGQIERKTAGNVLAAIDQAGGPLIAMADPPAAGDSAATKTTDESASKPKEVSSKEQAKIKHILKNVDSIIAKHHRNPAERKLAKASNEPKVQNQAATAVADLKDADKKDTQPKPVADQVKIREEARAQEAARNEQTQKEEEAKLAQLQNEAEGRLKANQKPDVQLPITKDGSTVEKVREAIALAEEQGVPLLVDIYAEWCGPCREMRDNALEFMEGKRVAASKQPVEAVYLLIDGDHVDPAVYRELNLSRPSAYPTLAIYGPPDYSSPRDRQSGGMSYAGLVGWINKYKGS